MQISHVGYQTRGLGVPNKYYLFSILYEITGGKKWSFLRANVVILGQKWPWSIFKIIGKYVMWGIKLSVLMSVIDITYFQSYMRSLVDKNGHF